MGKFKGLVEKSIRFFWLKKLLENWQILWKYLLLYSILYSHKLSMPRTKTKVSLKEEKQLKKTKTVTKKSAEKNTTAKKETKKAVAKKATEKKVAVKKTVAKKSVIKKVVAKKASPKKVIDKEVKEVLEPKWKLFSKIFVVESWWESISYEEQESFYVFSTSSNKRLYYSTFFWKEKVDALASIINCIVYMVKEELKANWRRLDYFEADRWTLQADYRAKHWFDFWGIVDVNLVKDVQWRFWISAKELCDWLNEYRKDVEI